MIRIMCRESMGGGLLREVEAPTLRDAVVAEVRAGRRLSGADLRGADLTGADLSHADLSHANLSHAYLSHAYLSHAYLSHANLSGARLAWASHALLSHILATAAGNDKTPLCVQRRMVAGLVAVSADWCWKKFLALPVDPATRAWALDTLAACIVEGDNAPDELIAWRDSRTTEGREVAP